MHAFKNPSGRPAAPWLARTLAAAALVAAHASAMAVTVVFSGSGLVTGGAQTPPQLVGLVLQSATSNYIVGGASGWHVDKVFGFNVATLAGSGTFTLSNGVSSLTGTFTSSRANATTAPTDLFYTVTGGSGLFAGLAGSGIASGVTVGNAFALPSATVTFTESGEFTLTPVPEPASAALLATGLLFGWGWRARAGSTPARRATRARGA